MRIAILSYYSGQSYRGAETFVHELANHLVALKCSVTVYQHGPATPGADYSIGQLDSLTSLPAFAPLPDIVMPTNGRWQSFLTKAWCLKHHLPMVIAGESGPGLDDRLNLYSFPDTFIGLTDFQCAWAKNNNPFVPLAKIPNGVDLRHFNSRVKPLKIDLPHPIILNVAALIPLKRQELLIQAAAHTQASLLLVGRGDEYPRLQSLGRQLLGDRFRIVSLPYDQMPSVYPACDLFSFPTVPWESFGIVILEAMASGLPIVASADPIRREIVGEAGILVNPQNVGDYAAGLQTALSTDWLSKPVDQAKKFSWDSVADRYYRLFHQLISP